MAKTDLTPEYLHQLFSYDPHDGLLRWKVRRSNVVYVGKPAGSSNALGYRIVGIDGGFYLAHRIIWTMMTGAWPTDQIDHINGTRSDNRFSNLREASNQLNCQNVHRVRKHSGSGIMGVYREGARFKAQISFNGNTLYIGTFPTPELAHAAYIEAKRRLHPGNTL